MSKRTRLSPGHDYYIYRFTAPGRRLPAAIIVAMDEWHAARILNNAVHGWDLDLLKLMRHESHPGPSHIIRLDPDYCVPKSPNPEPLAGEGENPEKSPDPSPEEPNEQTDCGPAALSTDGP